MRARLNRVAALAARFARQRGSAADEGIVRRHRAVGPDADDLAEMVAEVLRLVARAEMVAHAEKQIVVGCLRDAAAEMIAARERAVLMEDHLHILESRSGVVEEPCTGERRARAAADRLGKAEIDGVVLRVTAIEHDVVQAALARGEHLRHAGEWRRELAVLSDDAHAPRPLRDQHAAVGQERECPGVLEAARDGLDREIAGGGMKDLRVRRRAASRQEQSRAHRG